MAEETFLDSISPRNFSSWNRSCEHAGKIHWHLIASAWPHSAGRLDVGCLATATPEVSYLPAGVGCYFGEVKYWSYFEKHINISLWPEGGGECLQPCCQLPIGWQPAAVKKETQITFPNCSGTPRAENAQLICRDRGSNVAQHRTAGDMACWSAVDSTQVQSVQTLKMLHKGVVVQS